MKQTKTLGAVHTHTHTHTHTQNLLEDKLTNFGKFYCSYKFRGSYFIG